MLIYINTIVFFNFYLYIFAIVIKYQFMRLFNKIINFILFIILCSCDSTEMECDESTFYESNSRNNVNIIEFPHLSKIVE